MEQSTTSLTRPIAAVADGSPAAGDGSQPQAELGTARSPVGRHRETVPGAEQRAPWTLLSNHGLALLALAAAPSCRISEVARVVGITERATIRMINDLVGAGYVARTRIGRRNLYAVNRDARLRHPALRGQSLTALLHLVDSPEPRGEAPQTVIPLRGAAPRDEVVAGVG